MWALSKSTRVRQGIKGVVLWSHLMVVRGIVSLGQWIYFFSYLNPDKFCVYKDIVCRVYNVSDTGFQW